MYVPAVVTGATEHMDGHSARSATNAEAVALVGGADKRLELG